MGYSVLLVDDSETIRAVLAKTLKMAGLEINQIFQAENGRQALEIMDENWIDIVFADINMPVMGGMEMVDKMGENGQIETTPVVIVSTEGSRKRVDELIAKGVRAFVRKPATPEQFRDVILDVLGNEE